MQDSTGSFTYTYDAAGQLETMKVWAGTANYYDFNFTYDAAGQVTELYDQR